MRPVTIVVSGNYPYTTQASLNALVPAFTPPSAMNTVYNQALAFQRSIDWVEDELLDKVVFANAFPNPGNATDRRNAKKMMKSRLADVYGTARLPLAAMIGDYCSFCELPLAGHLLAVEHRSAKSPYPNYTTWWWNFLLACRDCNSFKGNRPTRATVTGWTGIVNPSENALYQEIRNRYFWPNVDTNTYRRVRVDFWMDTHLVVATRLTGDEFSNRNNTEVSAVGAVVRANVRQGGAMRANRHIEARVYNRKPDGVGARTLALTRLNDQGDDRCFLRTRAWMLCCLQRDLVLRGIEALPPANRAANFANSWTMLLMIAVLRGYYSTWVRVLSKRGFPAHVPNGGFANLGEKFVNDTQAGNAPNGMCIFAGTNVAKVP
jgi:hypothetical protein